LTLRVLDHIPEGFLDVSPQEVTSVLPGPTLLDLPGRIDQPLFVSALLHGDETTGLLAAQQVLRHHQDHGLPRRLLLFIGNVAAATADVRTLDHQNDFNRVWPSTLLPDTPEAKLMGEVVAHVRAQNPFASIDIHNNTGLNPHYACLNKLEVPFFHLARLFSRTVVFFEEPVGVQSIAMAQVCPAVTVECGRAGDPAATAHAAEFIEAALALSHFPEHVPLPSDFDLLRTFAILKVPRGASFSFGESPADIAFRADIDHFNFCDAPPGTALGTVRDQSRILEKAIVGSDPPPGPYLDYAKGEIRLAVRAVPSMLTRSVQAVRADCLCYLMHRIDLSGRRLEM
jgi:hypothetical protein